MMEQKLVAARAAHLAAAMARANGCGSVSGSDEDDDGGISAASQVDSDSAAGQVNVLGQVLPELPIVYGSYHLKRRPMTQRVHRTRQQVQRPVTVGSAGGSMSSRAPMRNATASGSGCLVEAEVAEVDERWAEEWLTAQRQEAARVMAAHQAAQAAQGVSLRDIDHALRRLSRPPPVLQQEPVRPIDLSMQEPILLDAAAPVPAKPTEAGLAGTAPVLLRHSPANRSSNIVINGPGPTSRPGSGQNSPRSAHAAGVTRSQWGVVEKSKIRIEKGRPLTASGGWRDDSTKIATTPRLRLAGAPDLQGAALVSTSVAAIRDTALLSGTLTGTGTFGSATTGSLKTASDIDALSPPPTAAVLTQGGHVPGWLRYTTMMMRTRPLEQVRYDRQT